ncbi:substrate-binding domain-containing protein [Marinomonas algicola]|uniref:substrate-binding domain-containing protein n=1 Tax=Marinomonas algicola TaxID=2773454 RepID=UPI00174D83AE|nr:substrate-binding domain-containing protein [Marinomonas algicola]
MKKYMSVLKYSAISLSVLMAASSYASEADDFVAMAKAKVKAATIHNSEWDGPTTGPKAVTNKTVVFLASDMRNGGVLGVSNGVEEAAAFIGWNVRVLDGQGTVSGRTSVFNQAMALKPDGIVLGGFDVKEQSAALETATSLGIKIVGWHSAPKPGPIPEKNMFTNITTDADDVAEIAALAAIAESDGKAGVVIFTDSAYEVAIAKSDAMAKLIEKCAGCTLISVEDTPLSDTSTRMPQLTTSLLQRNQGKWTHSLGINDLYFDYIGSSLNSSGLPMEQLPRNLSAGDGSQSAYARIRTNFNQTGTVPEPLNLHGWQIIDELNRAFSGVKDSGFSTPVYLVTPENIKFNGGEQDTFDPDNNYREYYKAIWK